MAAANPSIVIVPGAWCPAGLYQDFVVHLNNAGLSASVVDLPTCDVQDPVSVTVATDTQAVRDRILSLLDTENKDIIVLCHSYGGIPGGGGAAGLSKNARIREGKENGIVCLVYMTAFIVPEGPSLLDVMGGKHAPYVSENQVRSQSFLRMLYRL
ncbi:uncharacterized protein KY384_000046 [Bacidia gigantensis]|uniref:uncharacterized protein n=1 Tax=Bacidia gigantensis TaxID=2732470 RepID=UPI001D04EE59|nr:uncharacterized protein KY384_000046 [Bacidia gigantensis]KAG8526453.1 hypothetical protein KY384_000046 [Bacidia gigantensis]